MDSRTLRDIRLMLDADALDIQSITLGIPLSDCGSRLANTARTRVYDKVRRVASRYVDTIDTVAAGYGIRISNIQASVSPLSLISDGYTVSELVDLGNVLDEAGRDTGVGLISGYTTLLRGGVVENEVNFLKSIPIVLSNTSLVSATVRRIYSDTQADVTAFLHVAQTIKETAGRASSDTAPTCSRLSTICSPAQGPRTSDLTYHEYPGSEVTLDLSVTAGQPLLNAIQQSTLAGSSDSATDTIRNSAARLARGAEFVGKRCAEELSRRIGSSIRLRNIDFSVAADEKLIGRLIKAFGLENFGPSAATVASALLNRSVKAGAGVGSAHCRGLSPIARSAFKNLSAIVNYKLGVDGTSALSSAPSLTGLDVLAIPGDAAVESIAGLLLERLALEPVIDDETSLRIVPVIGKQAGERVDLGPKVGSTIVLPATGN